MRRALKVTGIVLGVVAALLLLASADYCGPWETTPPGLTLVSRGQGAVVVGAARAPIELPPSVTIGGFGPLRTASTQQPTLHARATVIDVGGQRLALVQLDVLVITQQLVTALRTHAKYPVWLVASHTHSGPGNYDVRLVAELAAPGAAREDVERALSAAAAQALADAERTLVVGRLEIGHGTLSGQVWARSSATVDDRLDRLRFTDEAGKPIAEWLVLSAHPTLVPRDTKSLSADYPGLVDAEGGPVRVVLQGAAGNASAAGDTPEGFLARLNPALDATKNDAPQGSVPFALASASLPLPRPQAPAQLPRLIAPLVENALCDDVEHSVEVWALKLGDFSLLAVPFEPTDAAGRFLETKGHASRVVGLANGYAGYVEPEGVARAAQGEAMRQYFGPELLSLIGAAAELVGDATR